MDMDSREWNDLHVTRKEESPRRIDLSEKAKVSLQLTTTGHISVEEALKLIKSAIEGSTGKKVKDLSARLDLITNTRDSDEPRLLGFDFKLEN